MFLLGFFIGAFVLLVVLVILAKVKQKKQKKEQQMKRDRIVMNNFVKKH